MAAQAAFAGGSMVALLLASLEPARRRCARRQPRAAEVLPLFGGVPESPKARGRSTIMQAPRAAGKQVEEPAGLMEKQAKLAQGSPRHQAMQRPAPRPASLGAAAAAAGAAPERPPAGPTLLRYRGPPAPPRATTASSSPRSPQLSPPPSPPAASGGGPGLPLAPAPGTAGAYFGPAGDDFEDVYGSPTVAQPAYRHGAKVEYYSKTEKRWWPATLAVVTKEDARGGCPLVGYEVTLSGAGRAVRRGVQLDELREPFRVGEAVEMLPESSRARPAAAATANTAAAAAPAAAPAVAQWMPAIVDGKATATSYRVRPLRGLDEAAEASSAPGQSGDAAGASLVRIDRLRRRFEPGMAVEAYLGPATGWAAGVVLDGADAVGLDARGPVSGAAAGVPVRVTQAAGCCAQAEKLGCQAQQQTTWHQQTVPMHLLRQRMSQEQSQL